MVIVASSTKVFTEQIMHAALTAKIDYIDLQMTRPKLDPAFEAELNGSGHWFITNGGFHPGVPGALVRYAATRLPSIERAEVFAFVQPDWKTLETTRDTQQEFLDEVNKMDNRVLVDGEWKAQGWSVTKEYDFGGEYKSQVCAPAMVDELLDLVPSSIPSLQNLSMYIGGFNPVTVFVVMPVCMLLTWLAPRFTLAPMSSLLVWSLRAFTSPPFGSIMALEASEGQLKGSGDDKRCERIPPTQKRLSIRVEHKDSYLYTAAPVVACALQILDGKVAPQTKSCGSSTKQGGLVQQASVVSPVRFLDDLERMGLNVEISMS